MKKLVAALIFLMSVQRLPAQTKPENILSPNMRIYEPKYLTRARGEEVARFVHSVFGGIVIYWEPVVKGLVLNNGTGKSDDLDKAENLIKRFDVPESGAPSERQIDMTVHLIRAYSDASRVKGSVPPELADVVKEMKGALPYAGFSLIDTIQLKVKDGLQIDDALPALSELPSVVPFFYSLGFGEPSISSDGKTVNVRHFRFGVKVPIQTTSGLTYQDEAIATPLTLYDNQKQVLGKVKLRTGDDLFVVLSCKVREAGSSGKISHE